MAGLIALLLDKYKLEIQAIYSIAYNLNKQKFLNNKKLIEELLSNLLGELIVKKLIKESARDNLTKKKTIEKLIKKLIKKSAGPLSIEEVIKYIKYIYPNNKIA